MHLRCWLLLVVPLLAGCEVPSPTSEVWGNRLEEEHSAVSAEVRCNGDAPRVTPVEITATFTVCGPFNLSLGMTLEGVKVICVGHFDQAGTLRSIASKCTEGWTANGHVTDSAFTFSPASQLQLKATKVTEEESCEAFISGPISLGQVLGYCQAASLPDAGRR